MKKSIILFTCLTYTCIVFGQAPKVECRHLSYYNQEARVLYDYARNNTFAIVSDFENYAICKGAKLIEASPIIDEKWTPYECWSDWCSIYSMSDIKSDTVSILVYKKEDSTLVKQFEYHKVSYKSTPLKAQLGYLKDTLVSVNDILQQNDLICYLENSYIFRYYKIFDYQLKIISNNNETFYLGGRFDDYVKNIIRDTCCAFRKKIKKDCSFDKKVVYLSDSQLLKYNEQSGTKLQKNS